MLLCWNDFFFFTEIPLERYDDDLRRVLSEYLEGILTIKYYNIINK